MSFRCQYLPATILTAFLGFGAPAAAEILGVDTFAYPDGPVADHSGGAFWDFNNVSGAHTGTPSDWDGDPEGAYISEGDLITLSGSASREFNGPSESLALPGDVFNGAINESNVHQQVYIRFTFEIPSSSPDSFLVSALQGNDDEFMSFGKAPGELKFGISQPGIRHISDIRVEGATTYRVVAKIDFAVRKASLFLNPSFELDESHPANAPIVEADFFIIRSMTGIRVSSTAAPFGNSRGLPINWKHIAIATTWPELGTVVTTLTDEDDGPSSLSSPADISLREAINYAPDGSLITFLPSLSGGSIDLDSELVISKPLAIDGTDLADEITIDGGSDGDFVKAGTENRCILISDGNPSHDIGVTLSGLIVQNGAFEGDLGGGNIHSAEDLKLHQCQILNGRSWTGNPFEVAGGGGICATNGSLLISHSRVVDNQTRGAKASGGGIQALTTPLTVLESFVADNQTDGVFAQGAGIHIQDETLYLGACTISGNVTLGSNAPGGGISGENSDLEITGSTLSGNQTHGASANGGGISADGGSLSLAHSTVIENQAAADGGGLSSTGGSTTLTQCIISKNGTSGNDSKGGGIFNENQPLVGTLTTVSNNETTGDFSSGGGLYSSAGTLAFTQSAIFSNRTHGTSALGAGVYSESDQLSPTSQFSNCTIANNSASGAAGGGIHNQRGLTVINYCTISGNSSENGIGAGVSSSSGSATNTEISNSIVRDNTAGEDVGLVGGQMNSFSFTNSNLIGLLGSNVTGIAANTAPLQIMPLGDFGGPTLTMPPLPGSPCILTGSSSARTDQRNLSITGPPTIGAVKAGDSLIVTTANDENDTIPGALISLREAIASAEPGAHITFSPTVFNDEPEDTIHLLHGEILIDKPYVIIDAADIPGGVTIDGGSDGDFAITGTETRCLHITDGDDNHAFSILLSGLTVQNGATGEAPGGGNIYNRENLTLRQCQILNGRSFGDGGCGGGVCSIPGNLTLIESTVSDNASKGLFGRGGGVYCQAGNLTITETDILNNNTSGEGFSHGGGVYSFSGDLEINLSDVSNNTVTGSRPQGGGVYFFGGYASLELSKFSRNRAEGPDATGGGIHSDAWALDVSQCEISENSALGFVGSSNTGGGIHDDSFPFSTTISHSTISGNEISGLFSNGGGLFSSSRSLELLHCTIANNTARDSGGGGIYTVFSETKIQHCTIVGNRSAAGTTAGISLLDRDDRPSTILNSIIRDNIGGEDLSFQSNSMEPFTVPDINTNLIGSFAGEITGLSTNTTPLLLAPLADYGGPTTTMPPLPGSPAIDTSTGSTATTDQRGFLISGAADVGATDYQGPSDFELALPLIWDIDHDDDGNSFGTEFALGTDPVVWDAHHPNNLRLDISATPTISFGYNPDAVGQLLWILESSTDLSTWTIRDSSANPMAGTIFIDPGALSDRATFYRFRADRIP